MAQFAQVLAEIGDFGRFQVRLLILLSVPNFLSAFYMFAQVFMVLDEAHHCSVAWVKNHTLNLSAAEQLALGVPLDATGSPEPCLMFRPPPNSASLEDILSNRFNETQTCQAGWDYPEGRPPSLKNEVGLPLPACLVCVVGVCPALCPCHWHCCHCVCPCTTSPGGLTFRLPVFLFVLCLLAHLPL